MDKEVVLIYVAEQSECSLDTLVSDTGEHE
jgi:hypothetical protein